MKRLGREAEEKRKMRLEKRGKGRGENNGGGRKEALMKKYGMAPEK
jgi:hypothetical protein